MDPIITLTTDFGVGSPYVAAMKGVMLSINPRARLIDLTHAIPPQDIRSGAIAISNTAPLFPAGTLHVGVVDPGVGSDRALIYVEIGAQRFVCPDNGLLSRLAERSSPTKIRAIANQGLFRRPLSSTFHGRDILAPVAAHLSLGVDADDLGPPRAELVTLDWPAPVMHGADIVGRRITGIVESIDSFGNLITNITGAMLAEVPRDASVGVFCDEHETRGIFSTYADQPPMTLVALIGSDEVLELAIVGDSAAAMLGVGRGAEVEVRW